MVHPIDSTSPTQSTDLVELSSQAPVGIGDRTSTLRSMAPSRDSGCCLWNMLSCIWNWFLSLFGCESKENLEEIFKEKVGAILENHFSSAPEGKVAITLTLDGNLLYQFGQITTEGSATEFKEQAIEAIKGQIGSADLSSHSKLTIETLFMTRSGNKNTFNYYSDSALKDGCPYVNQRSVNWGLTDEETAEYLAEYPEGVQQFFVAVEEVN